MVGETILETRSNLIEDLAVSAVQTVADAIAVAEASAVHSWASEEWRADVGLGHDRGGVRLDDRGGNHWGGVGGVRDDGGGGVRLDDRGGDQWGGSVALDGIARAVDGGSIWHGRGDRQDGSEDNLSRQREWNRIQS